MADVTPSTPPRRPRRRHNPNPPATNQPRLGMALLVILLATLPLLGILYLGAQWLRLPFSPLDLYDWPARAGFAPWISAIDQLNTAQTTGGGNLAQVAPVMQWLLALALFFALVFAVGLAFYAFVIRRNRVPDLIDGVTVGVILAAPMIFAALTTRSSPLPALLVVVWLGALTIVWGVVLSYAFGRLMAEPAPSPTPDTVPSAADGESPTPAGIDRRRFLLQFGASTAAVAAVTAASGAMLARREDAVALQRTLPMISPEFRLAEGQLFGDFRRFVIVRGVSNVVAETNVVALGTEYPDRNYVSIWLGGRSPIVIYENLETALAAYSTDEEPAGLFWLDQ